MNESTNTAPPTLLKLIGLQIHKDLHDQHRNVECLSKSAGLARSTLREIIAGKSNLRLMSLKAVTEQLGYKSLVEFFQVIAQ